MALAVSAFGVWSSLHVSRRERAADRERELVEAGAVLCGLLASTAQRGQMFRAVYPKLQNWLADLTDGRRLEKMLAMLGDTDQVIGAAIAAQFRIRSLTTSKDVHAATDFALTALTDIMTLATRTAPPTPEEWDKMVYQALDQAKGRLELAVLSNIQDLKSEIRRAKSGSSTKGIGRRPRTPTTTGVGG